MFERFTDRARRVVVLAQEEARMLNHNYIGTEHTLLGLLFEAEGIGAQALTEMGINLEDARAKVIEIIGKGDTPPRVHIPFTPRNKRVLELALREALQMGHSYIGTEHLLLGLIREGEGVAAQALVGLGADLNKTRQKVIEILNGPEPEPQPVDEAPSLDALRKQFQAELDKARKLVLNSQQAEDAIDAAKWRMLKDLVRDLTK